MSRSEWRMSSWAMMTVNLALAAAAVARVIGADADGVSVVRIPDRTSQCVRLAKEDHVIPHVNFLFRLQGVLASSHESLINVESLFG